MRGMVGSLLRRIHNLREDRGLNALTEGKFETPEQMGLWNRYGMTHEEFDEFQAVCSDRAAERYSNYIVLMDMLLGVKLEYKEKLWYWYFYTEFYSEIVKRWFLNR